jgi:hypothetical protein
MKVDSLPVLADSTTTLAKGSTPRCPLHQFDSVACLKHSPKFAFGKIVSDDDPPNSFLGIKHSDFCENGCVQGICRASARMSSHDLSFTGNTAKASTGKSSHLVHTAVCPCPYVALSSDLT